jgi:hypothetical protein
MVRRRDCPSEAWLTLLEKAFAQYVSGYPQLNGGFPFAALEALTGDPVRVFAYDDAKGRWAALEYETDVAAAAAAPHAPPPRVSSQLEHDALWALVKESFEAGHLIAAGTEGVIQSGQEDRQAYCIVELHEIGDLRLLCVRNPWGSFHWKGDWSEESELWDSRPDVTSVVNPVLETDSEFYISFDDFRHSFYQLYICARGTGRNTSLRFLTQAAFTEPAVLAKQQGAALAMRRAGTKRFYGVSSCLPRSRMVIERIGATAGNLVNRLNANAGMLASSCASVSRKGRPGQHDIVSPAEAASSLDDDASALGAPAAVGAPAAGGTVIGRPWAAVAALRSYLRPGSAAASASSASASAADGSDAAGAPAAGTPAAPAAGAAAGGTVLGYAVWPSARWSSYSNRPGPVTILRAYWRGEPLPTAAAPAAASAAGADGAPAAGAPADAPAARDAMREEAEGTPMMGRPVASAAAGAAEDDAVVGVPPMPVPALPVARPGHMRAPSQPGAPARAMASGGGDSDSGYDEPFGGSGGAGGSGAGPSGSSAVAPPVAAAPPPPAAPTAAPAAPAAPAPLTLEERAAARLAQRLAAVQGLGPLPVDVNGI